MKNIFITIIAFITFGCSTTKSVVVNETISNTPAIYKRVLLVTNTYHSEENIAKKLFNTEIKNNLTISKINTQIVELTTEKLQEENKFATYYLIKNNLDKTSTITKEQIQQKIGLKVFDNNIDLLITIQQDNVNRYYNKLNFNQEVFNKDSYNATTNATNLKYNYIITAHDIHKDTIVLNSKYPVQNADDLLFNKTSKNVSEFLINELKSKNLY